MFSRKPVLACVNSSARTIRPHNALAEHPAIAYDLQPDVVIVERPGLLVERRDEQAHEPLHLVGGSLPVLAGEREQGKDLDRVLAARLDDFPGRVDPGAMPGEPGQPTPPGPAAASVHDDCHVAGPVSVAGRTTARTDPLDLRDLVEILER